MECVNYFTKHSHNTAWKQYLRFKYTLVPLVEKTHKLGFWNKEYNLKSLDVRDFMMKNHKMKSFLVLNFKDGESFVQMMAYDLKVDDIIEIIGELLVQTNRAIRKHDDSKKLAKAISFGKELNYPLMFPNVGNNSYAKN